VADENDLVRVYAVIDELRRSMDGVDELGKDSAVSDPRAAFGQVEGKAMHAPGGHVHRLEGMVLLGIVVAVQHDDQRRLAGRGAQV
jgi:hypothetical protein